MTNCHYPTTGGAIGLCRMSLNFGKAAPTDYMIVSDTAVKKAVGALTDWRPDSHWLSLSPLACVPFF